jgi:hypothetical protein
VAGQAPARIEPDPGVDYRIGRQRFSSSFETVACDDLLRMSGQKAAG